MEADNDTTKKPPITIQQFIDAYMKKSKPISKRTDLTKNASNQSSTSEVKESCISEVTSDKKIGSNDGPDSYNEVSESESELLEEEHVSADAESNINVDEKVVEKPREADNAEQEEEEDDKIVFDIMDEVCAYFLYIQKKLYTDIVIYIYIYIDNFDFRFLSKLYEALS